MVVEVLFRWTYNYKFECTIIKWLRSVNWWLSPLAYGLTYQQIVRLYLSLSRCSWNPRSFCCRNLIIRVVMHLSKKSISDRIRKIYKKFPRISVPHNLDLAEDDDMQRLSEALGAAKTRAEGCSSFLKAAIKWDILLHFLCYLLLTFYLLEQYRISLKNYITSRNLADAILYVINLAYDFTICCWNISNWWSNHYCF